MGQKRVFFIAEVAEWNGACTGILVLHACIGINDKIPSGSETKLPTPAQEVMKSNLGWGNISHYLECFLPLAGCTLNNNYKNDNLQTN